MIDKYGSIFDTTAPFIAHGVNTHGVMGSGIAKQIKENFYPEFLEYQKLCNSYDTEKLVGTAQVCWTVADNFHSTLINLFTQDKPGPNAQYFWVLTSLMSAASQVGGTVAIPEIGSGIGGLQWAKVSKIVEAVEIAYPYVDFEVWHNAEA